MESNLKNKIYITGFSLIAILAIGTFGYNYITDGQYNLFTCFYMTMVTVTTIGYDEIIPLEYYSGGREFTVFIAFGGIGVLTYFISTVTAVIVSGQIKQKLKIKKMEKAIEKFEDHFIICGADSHSFHIIKELNDTKRKSVVVDKDQSNIDNILLTFPNQKFVTGDASHESIIEKAGVKTAKGLFATTEEDNNNLVICLLARRMNPQLRIISLCNDHFNEYKIKLAGADIVTSINYMGGMRMAAEMLRPAVTHMLDKMLSDSYKTLRLEQVAVSDRIIGKNLNDLNLRDYKNSILIAIQNKDELKFKPGDDYVFCSGDLLLVLTTPEERIELQKIV